MQSHSIPVTALAVGDKVEAHGAVFEITSTGESRGHIHGSEAYSGDPSKFIGPSPCAVPLAKWIEGRIVPGYFGPEKGWSFQGNALHQVTPAN